ncbi:DMT family transporter [Eubacterium multiforme]|uniref:Drug/metabolite transporter (DMT)-like permease n=1 Tax=Eubacterium multiforme TaxID=83339 RepID=A0ABT9UT49_9FIRM|nr:DMT family transporter [Eubacterium multiforme]MDQ0149503.1 drug/metabolite transporter (DMT)-like permease [Eubacterium multiforme]
MKSYKGIVYAILASVAFGLMPIFAKFTYLHGSNSNTVLFFRFTIAAVILLVYLIVKKVSLKVNKKQFIILSFIGLIGYTLTTQTLFMSYDYLNVGLATTLHFVYPAFVCILEYIFFKKNMSKNKVLSLIFAGVGVYSLIAFENNTLSTMGLFLAVFSGLSYGVNIVLLALKELEKLDNRVITMYVTFGASIGMFIYGEVTGSLITKINLELVMAYIFIAVVSTIIAMILLLKGIELIGPSSASILGTFEPIVSIIMGAFIFGEAITFALFLGGALILTSTIILARDKSGNETVQEVIEAKRGTNISLQG